MKRGRLPRAAWQRELLRMALALSAAVLMGGLCALATWGVLHWVIANAARP